MRWFSGFCLLVVYLAASAFAQTPLTAEQKQLNIDSFEKVWTTVRDKHWEKNPGGLDWQKIHEEFEPKARSAKTTEESRAVMREMLARLHETHFGILAATVYNEVGDETPSGIGTTGIDLRVLGGHAIVTSADAASPVKPGWEIVAARKQPIEAIVRQSGLSELMLTRAVLAKLSGPVGSKIEISF